MKQQEKFLCEKPCKISRLKLPQIIFQEIPNSYQPLCEVDMLAKVSEPGCCLNIQIRLHSLLWAEDSDHVAHIRSVFITEINKPSEDLDEDDGEENRLFAGCVFKGCVYELCNSYIIFAKAKLPKYTVSQSKPHLVIPFEILRFHFFVVNNTFVCFLLHLLPNLSLWPHPHPPRKDSDFLKVTKRVNNFLRITKHLSGRTTDLTSASRNSNPTGLLN